MKIEDFEIVNPVTSDLRNSHDTIAITTCSGSMWGKGNSCKNLLLTQSLVANSVIELTVDILPQFNGEQGGLILYVDDDNYIKLVREMVDGRQAVVLANEIKGGTTTNMVADFQSPRVGLRMVIEGERLTVGWKSPKADIYDTEQFEYWLGHMPEVRIGIFTHGSNPDNEAVFNGLNITDWSE
jgi:regulation of enolase protein 1 (concanavalin A-like superfamily)